MNQLHQIYFLEIFQFNTLNDNDKEGTSSLSVNNEVDEPPTHTVETTSAEQVKDIEQSVDGTNNGNNTG